MKHCTATLFLLFSLFLTPLLVRAQETNQTDANGLKQGKWVKKYPDGKPEYEGTFKDDKPVGLFKYFDISGNLIAKVNFNEDGSAHAEMYYEKGEVAAKGNYSAPEVKTGQWVFYDQYGNVRSEVHYKNNKNHGKAVYYYKDGSVVKETAFENGREQGYRKEYFANGNVKFEGAMLDGNFDGEIIIYHPNGQVDQKGIYRNAVRDSTWIYFDENGRTVRKIHYEKGNIADEEKLIDNR